MGAQNDQQPSLIGESPAQNDQLSRRARLKAARAASISARLDLQSSIEHALVRGLRYAEILRWLEREGKVSPRTGRPWPEKTVRRVIEETKQRWLESTQAIEEHYSHQLAVLKDTQNRAVEEKNDQSLFGAHDRIARLMGLDKPLKISQTNAAGEDVPLGPTILAVKIDTAVLTVEQMLWLDQIVSAQSGGKALLPSVPERLALPRGIDEVAPSEDDDGNAG